MCGIAGIAAAERLHPDDRARVVRMRAVISYRGPDGAGLHADECAVLGHRRLSIVDLAGGHQPLSNEDGTVWITYNGEVYNFRELKIALEAAGHRFATRCDTETIVHQYEQLGASGLPDLHGMFAFALWDQRAKRLLLARD